jgi:hypothetical protein
VIAGLMWIVAFALYLLRQSTKAAEYGPRTVQELDAYTQQRKIEIERSLKEQEQLHPECQELKQQWMESEQNILCGKCNKPLFPKGIGDTLYLVYTCPHCGAFNGQNPLSGVSHFEPRITYYWPIGYGEWNELRKRYFECIGWWK